MTTKRYESLDILRGITIAFMCIVNNPGTWEHVFPPLLHAEWNGCTPTDLVYPFFIFCAGCAMAFSFSKFEGVTWAAVRKLLVRGAALFAIGFVLNLYTIAMGYVRIFGVLQRIGLAYMVGGLFALWLRQPKKIIAAIAVLLTFHTAILLIFGQAPGAFTLEGNVAGRIDTWLVGEKHVMTYDGGVHFDPEGLLGLLTASCTTLLGYLAGWTIRRGKERTETVCRIFASACVCLALAMVLTIWIPLNKSLWTASFTLYTGGWAMLALAFLAYVVDVRGWGRPLGWLKVYGTNPLLAYILCSVLYLVLAFTGLHPGKYFAANELTSLLWAVIYAGIIFLILYPLYKKKIYIKL